MQVFLAVISGICWTLVYVEAIRVGLRDRSYAMPLFALGLNLAWEVTYSIAGLSTWETNGLLGNTIAVSAIFWALFDLGILWTYLKYGRRYWPTWLAGWTFGAWTVFVLVVTAGVQLAYLFQFGAQRGGTYAAYGQNLLMSLLFIAMWLHRRGPEGQSVWIAWGKLLGTLAPTISFGYLGGNVFVAVVGSACLAADALYVLLLTERLPLRLAQPAGAAEPQGTLKP